MNKRIVTSYEEPDLDGVSSMYAYAEYLNKIGIPSAYYIKGNPKKEVEIVCDLFGIDLVGSKEISEEQEAVLLDKEAKDFIQKIKDELPAENIALNFTIKLINYIKLLSLKFNLN